MARLSEIQEALAKYLAGDISLPDFEDRFVQSSWNIHKSNYSEARRFVHSIELRLSEVSSGHLSEDDLRQQLASLTLGAVDQIQYDAPIPPALDVNWLEVGQLVFAGPAGRESSVVFSSIQLHL
jgi:hypothetical protein